MAPLFAQRVRQMAPGPPLATTTHRKEEINSQYKNVLSLSLFLFLHTKLHTNLHSGLI